MLNRELIVTNKLVITNEKRKLGNSQKSVQYTYIQVYGWHKGLQYMGIKMSQHHRAYWLKLAYLGLTWA